MESSSSVGWPPTPPLDRPALNEENGMYKATKSGNTCVCPTCAAYTMAMPGGQGDYCPSCFTVVRQVRGVKLVQPNGLQSGAARG